MGSVGIAVPRLSASMLGRATGKNHKVALRCLIVIVYRLYLSIPETKTAFKQVDPTASVPIPHLPTTGIRAPPCRVPKKPVESIIRETHTFAQQVVAASAAAVALLFISTTQSHW